MLRLWGRFIPLFLLVLAGCGEPRDGSAPIPTAPQELLGGVLGGGKTQGYTLVKDPLLPGITEPLSVSALIGAKGGSLTLLGHTLTVPADAVKEPTLFTLTVLPTGYVEVDLSATVTTLLGTVLDVGGDGFAKPVPVSLTYSRATNVRNPGKLTVLRVHSLLGYDSLEALPSKVDTGAQTVTTKLDHFSRYALGFPN